MIAPISLCAQEKDTIANADEYLEAYNDDFQQYFFEALKQKGLQNFDRAIASFFKAKELKSDEHSLDYEIGKAYLWQKKYVEAENYLQQALQAAPDNYWYLEALVQTYNRQGRPIGILEGSLDLRHSQQRYNLARALYKSQQLKQAAHYLEALPKSEKKLVLSQKIEDAMAYRNRLQGVHKPKSIQPKPTNPLEEKKEALKELYQSEDFAVLYNAAAKALERYPAQPYFYYMQGLAANKLQKYKESITVLEMGLDFLIDDQQLNQNIIKELIVAYEALGNSKRANRLRAKLKS